MFICAFNFTLISWKNSNCEIASLRQQQNIGKRFAHLINGNAAPVCISGVWFTLDRRKVGAGVASWKPGLIFHTPGYFMSCVIFAARLDKQYLHEWEVKRMHPCPRSLVHFITSSLTHSHTHCCISTFHFHQPCTPQQCRIHFLSLFLNYHSLRWWCMFVSGGLL